MQLLPISTVNVSEIQSDKPLQTYSVGAKTKIPKEISPHFIDQQQRSTKSHAIKDSLAERKVDVYCDLTKNDEIIHHKRCEEIKPNIEIKKTSRKLSRSPALKLFATDSKIISENKESQDHYVEHSQKIVENLSRSEDGGTNDEYGNNLSRSPRNFLRRMHLNPINSASRSSEQSSSPRTPKVKNFKISEGEKKNNILDRFETLEDNGGVSSIDIDKFNIHLNKGLVLKSMSLSKDTKYLLNPEERISDLCSKTITSLFQNGGVTLEKFKLCHNDIVFKLMDQITTPSFLLTEVLSRLETLKNDLFSYISISHCKSRWSVKLYEALENLMYSKNLGEIFYILKKVASKEENEISLTTTMKLFVDHFAPKNEGEAPSIKKLIFCCIGRSSDEVEKMLGLLEKWGDRKKIHHLRSEIFAITMQMAEIIELNSQKHLWRQNPKECPISIDKINADDIYRSWKQEKRVLFKLVTVNDVIIYQPPPPSLFQELKFSNPHLPNHSEESSLEEEISEL